MTRRYVRRSIPTGLHPCEAGCSTVVKRPSWICTRCSEKAFAQAMADREMGRVGPTAVYPPPSEPKPLIIDGRVAEVVWSGRDPFRPIDDRNAGLGSQLSQGEHHISRGRQTGFRQS